jgi:hypothetical protein
MRVPFIRLRKKRDANGGDFSVVDIDNGSLAAGEPVSGGQGASVPLPRRQPGSHGANVVKADPASADPATLRKIIDGLKRM